MPISLNARAQSALSPSRAGRRAARVAIAVLAAALLMGACGTSGSTDSAAPEETDPPPTSTTLEPSTTTTAAPTPEAAVLDAVAGYWRTFFEANDPPNPAHPGYARYYTGEALKRSTGNTQNRLDVGTAVKPGAAGLFASRPTVVDVAGDHAVVDDCVLDDSTLVERATGRELNNTVDTNLMRLQLQLEEGVWKVASNTVLATFDGARASCT